MSQVVVVEDVLTEKRRRSAEQEKHIDIDAVSSKWRKNDVTKVWFVEKIIGYAVLPIVLLWAFIVACGSLALAFSLFIIKGLARLVGSHGGTGQNPKGT